MQNDVAFHLLNSKHAGNFNYPSNLKNPFVLQNHINKKNAAYKTVPAK